MQTTGFGEAAEAHAKSALSWYLWPNKILHAKCKAALAILGQIEMAGYDDED